MREDFITHLGAEYDVLLTGIHRGQVDPLRP